MSSYKDKQGKDVEEVRGQHALASNVVESHIPSVCPHAQEQSLRGLCVNNIILSFT